MPHNVYIAKDTRLTKTKLVRFVRQYKNNKLRRLELIDNLKYEWREYVGEGYLNDEPIQIQLPVTSELNKEIPTKSGVYAIFAKRKYSRKPPVCFYVGMSGNGKRDKILGRLRTHLRKAINENHRGVFLSLKVDYSEIFICYATISKPDNIGKMKEKLELLELCLTAELRPIFLALVAED